MLNLKNTLDGYLKNVEVIGNTIQDTNNLTNIRSVGDKVEGQELYKIPVVSCGKNMFNGRILRKEINTTYSYDGTDLTLYRNSGNTQGRVWFNKLPIGTYTLSFQIKSYPPAANLKFRVCKNLGEVGGVIRDFYLPQSPKSNKITFTLEDDMYISVETDYSGANIVISNIQLEEGNVATEYEPHQEQKLEILSPVQLEKVGDVADRIICKDGVWGIEKNIKTYTVSQDTVITHHHNHENGTTSYRIENVLEQLNSTVITSKFNQILFSALFSGGEIGHASHEENTHLYVRLEGNTNIDIVKQQLQGMLIKYMTSTPQFIPLPHDQQVKLRTFAGQTNVFFNTEIPGQIKAQVPKSLGAVVNTHTEQIEMLHNALKSVLAGDMYSLATILYPEDFIQNDNTEQDIMVIPE